MMTSRASASASVRSCERALVQSKLLLRGGGRRLGRRNVRGGGDLDGRVGSLVLGGRRVGGRRLLLGRSVAVATVGGHVGVGGERRRLLLVNQELPKGAYVGDGAVLAVMRLTQKGQEGGTGEIQPRQVQTEEACDLTKNVRDLIRVAPALALALLPTLLNDPSFGHHLAQNLVRQGVHPTAEVFLVDGHVGANGLTEHGRGLIRPHEGLLQLTLDEPEQEVVAAFEIEELPGGTIALVGNVAVRQVIDRNVTGVPVDGLAELEAPLTTEIRGNVGFARLVHERREVSEQTVLLGLGQQLRVLLGLDDALLESIPQHVEEIVHSPVPPTVAVVLGHELKLHDAELAGERETIPDPQEVCRLHSISFRLGPDHPLPHGRSKVCCDVWGK